MSGRTSYARRTRRVWPTEMISALPCASRRREMFFCREGPVATMMAGRFRKSPPMSPSGLHPRRALGRFSTSFWITVLPIFTTVLKFIRRTLNWLWQMSWSLAVRASSKRTYFSRNRRIRPFRMALFCSSIRRRSSSSSGTTKDSFPLRISAE